MKKLTTLIGMIMLFASSTVTGTSNYQDWWWNPDLSGMGWNVGQQDNTITVAWYLYDSSENPTFLTLAGPLVGNAVEGTLFESFGPPPGPGYNPDDVERIDVGTARLVFQSSNQATFTYDYDGSSDTITLERLSYDFEDFSGEYTFLQSGITSECTSQSENGPFTETGSLVIDQNGNSGSGTQTFDSGGACTYNMTFSQQGSYYDGTGTFSCNFGFSGTADFSDLRKIDNFLIFEIETRTTSGETCIQQGEGAAVRD
jgi:hypothetical protein